MAAFAVAEKMRREEVGASVSEPQPGDLPAGYARFVRKVRHLQDVRERPERRREPFHMPPMETDVMTDPTTGTRYLHSDVLDECEAVGALVAWMAIDELTRVSDLSFDQILGHFMDTALRHRARGSEA